MTDRLGASLSDLIRNAYRERGVIHRLALKRGLAIDLYIDAAGAYHIMLWREGVFPSLYEWEIVMAVLKKLRVLGDTPQPEEVCGHTRRALRAIFSPPKLTLERTLDMGYDEISLAKYCRMNYPIYLDTETTGLDERAEMVQIAIIDDEGNSLLDTLVRPTRPIPEAASAIHYITDDMVRGAPLFADVWPTVKALIRNRLVVIYNADYDFRICWQSAAANGFELAWPNHIMPLCAMRLYADYRAEWNEYRHANRWHKLTDACLQQRISMDGIRAHSAAGDCELTRRLVHCLAEKQIPETWVPR